jgi:DNA repair and recombination RAD54-like protein
MLRRLPQSKPGDQPVTSATSGGFGIVSKPYKKPSALAPTRTLALPARKRKAVSYKEQGGGKEDAGDGDASDGEGGVKKKGKFEMGNKVYGDDGVLGDMAKWCNRKFPVFEKKDRTVVFAKG